MQPVQNKMTRLANILIAGPATPRTDKFSELLSESNCNAMVCPDVEQLMDEARTELPDLIIVDMDAESGFDGIEVGERLRADRETLSIPIVAWKEDPNPEIYERALAVGFDDVYSGALRQEEISLRLHPVMRLSTQLAEMRRRTALARDFGADIPVKLDLATEPGPFSILAVACTEEQTVEIKDAMGESVDLSHCEAPLYAREVLNEGRFDSAVIGLNAPDSVEDVIEFCEEVRNNPRLFNLPIVILRADDVDLDAPTAMRHGASRLLSRTKAAMSLQYVLATLGNRQRLRWRIREIIQTTRCDSSIDKATATYRFDFFRAYLDVLTAEAREWQRHVTLLSFNFEETATSIRGEFGAETADTLIRQVAQWIRNLLRLEDVVAHYGEGAEFCVALPDTPLEVAEAVMNRIAGILGYTDFALPDVFRPIDVSVTVGAAELEADDEPAALIDRARANLE